MKIAVIGSSNIDLVAQVNHLPKAGETVGNAKFFQTFGGKGANQAIATARLGGEVVFVTALGNDMYAEMFKKQLEQENIQINNIQYDMNNSTGTALIYVADNGENCIAVASGANMSLVVPQTLPKLLNDVKIVLMQAEVPYRIVKEVALEAKSKSIKVIFNPAPACDIDTEFMNAIVLLIVNETEAE